MGYDFMYKAYQYLNNLEMFKHLSNANIDISIFYNLCTLHEYSPYGECSETGYTNILTIFNELFEIVETYHYYDNESDLDDIKYWLKQAEALESYDCHSIRGIVLLDSQLRLNSNLNGIAESEFTHGVTDLLKLDDGILIIFDLDYGEPNWANLLFHILSCSKYYKKEGDSDEMGI